MLIEQIENLFLKCLSKKYNKDASEQECKFKTGDYVSRISYEPYCIDEKQIEYAEIKRQYSATHPQMYIVRNLSGGEDLWHADSMSKLSELDAFLRTLES